MSKLSSTLPDPAGTSNGTASVPTNKQLDEFFSEWQELCQEDISSQDYYFNSYAHFGVHEEMLKDSIRTGAYQHAILDNPHLFRDKIVLDVGSGTGILSLFAATAGARHVYSIECSEIVELAKKIVAANNLSHKITFIKGKAEEVELPVDKVDIILSEWMGYFLLYESMLDSVLYCRDKWLRKGGLLFPDRASLYIAAIEDEEYKGEKIGFWRDVYGYDFSCVKRCALEEPIVDYVEESAVATSQCCILDLDLNTCKKEHLNFCAPYKLHVNRRDFLHAFVAWFDVSFTFCHKLVGFTTGPFGRPTHWKQTVLYMDDVIIADVKDVVEGIIAVRKSTKNHRDIDIKLSYATTGTNNIVRNVQFYRLR